MCFFNTPPFLNQRILRSISIAEVICLFFFVILAFATFPCLAADPSPSFMPLMVKQTAAAASFNGTPDLIFGLFIGVMLTASLYLFFIWVVIHDRGQVFLMLLLVCLGINMASTNDSMAQFMGIYSPHMRSLLQTYSMILAYFFGLFFTYYFLDIDASAPHMKIPLGITAALLILLLVYTSIDLKPVHFVLPMLGVLSIAIVLLTGLSSIQSGTSGVISHITAFSALLVGSVATPLYDLGYIPNVETATSFTYLGFSIAAMMFAIVIAGQFAARQEEKERELEVSNERFSLAARGSNEGLFDWDRKTNRLYVSEQFRRILGVKLKDKPKDFKNWLKLVYPKDRLVILRAMRRLSNAQGSSTISFEYRVTLDKDECRWIHTKMIAIKSHASGNILRLVGSIGDITLSKKSEYELRASETRFRSITEAHPVPVLIIRLKDNQILYASPGAETLLGLPSGTLISNTIDRFLTRTVERREIISAISSGEEINMREVTIARGDAEAMPAAMSARRISYRNEDSMVIGLYDLTEQKKAEIQIAQQQEALQQSEKMAALGGLLAGVAHELNNPLSVVMGQTTLLIEGQNEDKTKTRAEKIFKAADRCSRIVKSFLALARRKPPEHKDIDLNNVISGSLELLGYQFRNENVEVILNLTPSLPKIIGDDDQLTQVFTNLALNAAQAMHDWPGERKLTITTKIEDEHNLMVSVIDTGPGIPLDLRKKVFEPFFTTKGGSGGTGVGLALCLNIIEGHGGKMILEETSGSGASFHIRLPIAQTAHQEDKMAPQARQTTLDQKLRILIVDDEIELAQTLADLLDPGGHEIDLAANGAIAIEKLQKKPFDVIISDLRMPVLDGPSLYAKLAESLPQYLTKIIYVTGDTLSTHVNSFLSQTPVPVIEKPYRLTDVQEAIVKLLKENETQSSIKSGDSNLRSTPQ